MHRLFVAAAVLLIPVSGQAQYAVPERQMPEYNDHQPVSPNGYEDSYGTADTHHWVDQTPPPPPVPQGYGYGDYGAGPSGGTQGWQSPGPYGRSDQVDEGRETDAAHRADRAYTADLNRRQWPGRNARVTATPDGTSPPETGDYARASRDYRAQLAAHQRAMDDYRSEQSGYADRIARWRARADACEAGDMRACGGPDR